MSFIAIRYAGRRLLSSKRSVCKMSSGVDKVNDYLRQARGSRDARVVIGNESADMDSIVSAITLSYVRSMSSGQVHVPVLNTKREDLRLRMDVEHLLQLVGIDSDCLTFVEEIDLSTHADYGIILVDHNRLKGPKEIPDDAVVEIIDHHEDEGYHQAARRTLQKVGSCSTLVVESFKTEQERALLIENTCLCQLILSAILMDTANHDQEQQRSTALDKTVDEMVRAKSDLSDVTSFYSDLLAAKMNQKVLSTADLLRRDYKQWLMGTVNVGISSVGLSLTDWLDRDQTDFEPQLRSFMQGMGLDVLIVMTAFMEDNGFCRQFLIFSEQAPLRDYLIRSLANEESGLQLETFSHQSLKSDIPSYNQKNIKASRKVAQPVIAKVLASYGT